MTIEFRGKALYVRLSRRNLMALLAKLDGYPPDSYCTIFKTFEEGVTVWVTAEEDPATAGVMHPATEAAIAPAAELREES